MIAKLDREILSSLSIFWVYHTILFCSAEFHLINALWTLKGFLYVNMSCSLSVLKSYFYLWLFHLNDNCICVCVCVCLDLFYWNSEMRGSGYICPPSEWQKNKTIIYSANSSFLLLFCVSSKIPLMQILHLVLYICYMFFIFLNGFLYLIIKFIL